MFDSFRLDHFINDEKIMFVLNSPRTTGFVDDILVGWWVDVKVVLLIAYSNQ
jgi:hypothetical protein